MSYSIKRFFEAWGAEEGATDEIISEAMTEGAYYADPRSQGGLSGPQAISQYVKMFGANAPGWTAKVIKEDVTADYIRVTVAFGGIGPDGSTKVQHGQYFVEMENGCIKRMIGFAGTGV